MIGNAQTKVNEGLRMPLDWIAHPHQSATTKEFALEHTYHENRAEISAFATYIVAIVVKQRSRDWKSLCLVKGEKTPW